MSRQTDRQAYMKGWLDRQTDRLERETGEQTDRQAYMKGWLDRQTDRQTRETKR